MKNIFIKVLVFLCFLSVFNPCVFATELYPGFGTGTISISNESVEIGGLTDSETVTNQESAWNKVFKEYQTVITGISGVCAMTFIVFFIVNFIKLGSSAGNSSERSRALIGLVWTGIAAAAAGGVAIFSGFFYNMFE